VSEVPGFFAAPSDDTARAVAAHARQLLQRLASKSREAHPNSREYLSCKTERSRAAGFCWCFGAWF